MKKILINFVVLLLISQNSSAQSDSDSAELARLKARLEALEKKIAQQDEEKKSDDVLVTLKPSPSFKTRDGKSSFVFDGRFQFDAGGATKGKTSSVNNAMSVRRARLGLTGVVNGDWTYRLMVGFENNQSSLYDAFVKYDGFKNFDVKVGNFFENNGIDISSRNHVTPLMERSAGITTFRQFRRTGVSINPYGENWGGHFGVFGSNPSNSSTSAVNANNKGQGLSGRLHFAVINDKKSQEFLHLGVNATRRVLDSGANSVTGSNKTMRFNSVGDTNVVGLTLIDTGNIANVNSYYQNMGEFRYQNGSLTLTSEFIRTTVNRKGAKDLNFNGGYLMGSYFLTGEKYGYDSRAGIQTAPTIGGSAAWEVAMRYSVVDLNSKDIRGGKLNSYDFGVNYYPNGNLKFMMNYIINRTDSAATVRNNPQYLLLRMQFGF